MYPFREFRIFRTHTEIGADHQVDNRAGARWCQGGPFASAMAGGGKSDLSVRSLDITNEVHYYCLVIVSFRDKGAEKMWKGNAFKVEITDYHS